MEKSKKTIVVDGKEYPCRVTMGALLRFKRETGKDAAQISQDDVADLITLLWCCVASACAGDHVSFGMKLMDFADQLDPDALTGFYASMGEENPPSPSERGNGDPEKKTGAE